MPLWYQFLDESVCDDSRVRSSGSLISGESKSYKLNFGFRYETNLFTFCVIVSKLSRHTTLKQAGLSGAVGCASDWRPGGRGFDPRRGRQHSFVEIDHEIFSTVILSLPLIQEGQLSVSGERMCTILVNRLED